MSKAPPVSELEFLKLSGNHAELGSKLLQLGCPTPDIRQFAEHVCESWFNLGAQHLAEAKNVPVATCPRTVLSRSYYAVYNASKAVRYMVNGQVSLKGDDHKQAGMLPDDFPEVALWSEKIVKLYGDRLYADYDNWTSTQSEFNSTPSKAIQIAEDFVTAARGYLNQKYNLSL